MTVFKAGLGSLFLSAGCLAFCSSYHVHSGDTLDSIAHKFHVSVHQLAVDNGLNGKSVLRRGMSLDIPSSSHSKSSHTRGHGNYVVKNGQSDWIIAHHNGLTVPQLHDLNPGIDWNHLQPGTHLEVSGHASKASHETSSHRESHESSSSHASGDRTYTVHGDDNDWSIAKKLGITHHALLELNPDTNWNALRPGQKLNAPGHRVTMNFTRGTSDYVAIAADNVTLRRGPSTDSDKVTEVNAGTVAHVIKEKGHWYQLKFPKGTVAWVRSDYLVAAHHQTESDYAYHPSRKSHHETYALRRSRHGFIHGSSDYAVQIPSGVGSNKLMRAAYSMRGTPYVWGGTSRSGGFDCSGFTSTVYRKDGVSLPRTSREQSEVGHEVQRGSLKKGDLVFFKTLGSHHINHVGIYIGNGKFIHASSGRGHVTVSNLNDGYYKSHFAEARRVLKASKKSSKKKK